MITIITVYKSNNYGSFWQAKILGEVFSKYDFVQYLDFGQRKWIDVRFLRSIYRNMTKGFSLKKIRFVIDLFVQNYRLWKKVKAVSLKNDIDSDLYVIGSDEIWNISRKNCNNPLFFGGGINGKKISYAPSINSAPAELFCKYPIAQYLRNLSCISVRDDYSRKVLSDYTQKKITITLDPTLLVDADVYQKYARCEKLPFKYIAIYIFPGGDDSYQEIITDFARRHNCKIVSIGTYLSWCDLNITARNCENPFLYYINAEFVFANTFHGTAFAINFEKQFVSFAISEKIKDLLRQFDLLERDVSCGARDRVLQAESQPIDYKIVNETKNLLRRKSYNYIDEAMSLVQGMSNANTL